jgi:hypothetical protein
LVSTLAPIKLKNRFQKLPFKCNLHRYATVDDGGSSYGVAAGGKKTIGPAVVLGGSAEVGGQVDDDDADKGD